MSDYVKKNRPIFIGIILVLIVLVGLFIYLENTAMDEWACRSCCGYHAGDRYVYDSRLVDGVCHCVFEGIDNSYDEECYQVSQMDESFNFNGKSTPLLQDKKVSCKEREDSKNG